ncbi:DNA cytosine methyltransferase [Amphibacillus indicireducens]|uniref:Cytosine-specific methyltransferase n=1 Tax=Amphibacillus indicireducens TaxID=1076330 RepID=A0ABP7V1K2_9BACI
MPYAIDLFCGAGGFSEGILQSGFDIVFSSDKSPMAQETYTNRHKELGIEQGIDTHFELADIQDLTVDFIFKKINSLKYGEIFKYGSIDAIFGGPPCQGFSRLGKRDVNDPRNMLFHEYLRIIKGIRPKYVVMENVTGILDMQLFNFPSLVNQKYLGQHSVPEILKNELIHLGYTVLDMEIINAADFGVPQQRNRAFFLAYRNDVHPLSYPKRKSNRLITVHDAFGDLYSDIKYSTSYSQTSIMGRTPSKTNNVPIKRRSITNMEKSNHDITVIERFSLYNEGENRRKALNRIQKEGIDLFEKAPNLFFESLFHVNGEGNAKVIRQALTKFNSEENINFSDRWLYTTNKQLSTIAMINNEGRLFEKSIKALSRRIGLDYSQTIEFWFSIKDLLNEKITAKDLQEAFLKGDIDAPMIDALFTKKGIRTRLDSCEVSPTMVTLPDDYIHPFLNRILTVREMARLQSFDDSFEFLGKRTTGGDKRAVETPQFTQVGNAVPPLLAKAVASEVIKAIKKTESKYYLKQTGAL